MKCHLRLILFVQSSRLLLEGQVQRAETFDAHCEKATGRSLLQFGHVGAPHQFVSPPIALNTSSVQRPPRTTMEVSEPRASLHGALNPKLGILLSSSSSVEARFAIPPVGNLFCWSFWAHDSERVLLEYQKSATLGLARCEAFSLFGPAAIGINVSVGRGGPFKTSLNWPIFISLWKKIFNELPYANYEWTVKVDPDTAFFPDMLKDRLALLSPSSALYLGRDQKVDDGSIFRTRIHGPLEVLSRAAMRVFAQGIDSCIDQIDCSEASEDVCLYRCAQHLNVPSIRVENVLFEVYKPPVPICLGSHVAIHPYKNLSSMLKCYDERAVTAAVAVDQTSPNKLTELRVEPHGSTVIPCIEQPSCEAFGWNSLRSKRLVVDAFPYKDETDTFALRRRELSDVVNWTSILWSPVTLRGGRNRDLQLPPLPPEITSRNNVFELPGNMFDLCHDDRGEESHDARICRLNVLKNAVALAVEKIPKFKLSDDDWVVFSDVDEIPDANFVKLLHECELPDKILNLRFQARSHFLYSTQCRYEASMWLSGAKGPIALRVGDMRRFGLSTFQLNGNPEWCSEAASRRMGLPASCNNLTLAANNFSRNEHVLGCSSWHLSTFGGSAAIRSKAHANADEWIVEDPEDMILQCKEGDMNRSGTGEDSTWPTLQKLSWPQQGYPDTPRHFKVISNVEVLAGHAP